MTTKTAVYELLHSTGPSRASKVTELLISNFKLNSDNARQVISRSVGKGEVARFPVKLLPNNEAFLYLKSQRNTDDFWINFLAALREAKSVYAMAIDSLVAKKGVISAEHFPIIAGAPLALKKQVTYDRLVRNLEEAGFIEKEVLSGVECIKIRPWAIEQPTTLGIEARRITENVLLDGFREWARKLGLGSYNKIYTRNDGENKSMVGQFKWDLSAPSYILPLKTKGKNFGFLVADVFVDQQMDSHQIDYFIRKVELLKSSINNISLFPVLMANGFTGEAFSKGRQAGIILATIDTLFGVSVANGIRDLLATLNNAAATAAANPEKLLQLINQLKSIEGSAGNLRGILFELISAYIAKAQGGSIEIGIVATNAERKSADIDVLRIINKGECLAIECKGKIPGGKVSKNEVEQWLAKIPIIQAYLRQDRRTSEAEIKFELWTSGDFHTDAIELLELEKKRRKRTSIAWKCGQDVFSLSKSIKEKRINDALKEHFLAHPLNRYTDNVSS